SEQWGTVSDSVDGVTIADQNPQRPFRSRSGNMYGDLVYQPLASIGTEHRLDIDLIAGTGFGHVRAGGLQAGPTTISLQIKIQLHATDIGHRVRIVVNETEPVTQRKRSQYRGRLS